MYSIFRETLSLQKRQQLNKTLVAALGRPSSKSWPLQIKQECDHISNCVIYSYPKTKTRMYPLVNSHIIMERLTMFQMGKLASFRLGHGFFPVRKLLCESLPEGGLPYHPIIHHCQWPLLFTIRKSPLENHIFLSRGWSPS